MRNVDGATYAHLQARAGTIPRDFLWLTGRNRESGLPESVGFWNDLDTVAVTVISGETGLPVARSYTGSGSLISSDPIPLTSDLTIRTIRIRLSQVNEAVIAAIRGYDPRLARVEFHRGLLDPETRNLVAAPLPHFVGFVNAAPIKTPPPGQVGDITISVVSHARELTRTNAAKKSDETQKRRSGCRFRRYSTVAGNWEFWWGEKKGRAGGSGG